MVYREYCVCGNFQNKGSAVCSYNGVKADAAEQAVMSGSRQRRHRRVGAMEICLDKRLQGSFLGECPSGSPEGPFDVQGVLPLTITL